MQLPLFSSQIILQRNFDIYQWGVYHIIKPLIVKEAEIKNMAVSTFQLFSIGIGPSSSHTVGPMRAARLFVMQLREKGLLAAVVRLVVDLYGSLALTGKGHSTDTAVILGLSGYKPEEVDSATVPQLLKNIHDEKRLSLMGDHSVSFDPHEEILFHHDHQLPFHPNGMRFTAFACGDLLLSEQVYYSVGGGFIVPHGSELNNSTSSSSSEEKLPYPFHSGHQLLELCHQHNLTIARLMVENEKIWRSEGDIYRDLLHIWQVMRDCIARGCQQEGILPGGLGVRRRAAALHRTLEERRAAGLESPASLLEWVSLWALAVNEENAAGGRVVTAPTNGAAGVIPAVIQYYLTYHREASDEGIVNFLLTAAAIGILYKSGASISAAEMGCMGEVGVACSMAAAGLTAVLGGTILQVENAAEIGMEHNLGLTCDPVKGLVQIPCIERNTMGAVKAINAAFLALNGDGLHRIPLDHVIATMRQTGHDMQSIYKETSQGGLAVNVPEC